MADEPEDLGYVLGWTVIGEPLCEHDEEGCEAARAIGAAIVGCEEMRAVKAVLRRHGIWQAMNAGASSRDVLRLLGLPDVVVDWVLS